MTEPGTGEGEPSQRLRALLDGWAAGIAERRTAEVADLFAEDALFQGFDPSPGRGRAYIDAYYAKQPLGLTADYELLAVRELSDVAVVGYARVRFARPEGAVMVYLTVIGERLGDSWLLTHYHVSKIDE